MERILRESERGRRRRSEQESKRARERENEATVSNTARLTNQTRRNEREGREKTVRTSLTDNLVRLILGAKLFNIAFRSHTIRTKPLCTNPDARPLHKSRCTPVFLKPAPFFFSGRQCSEFAR